jgi:hypothetical protein
MDEDRRAHYAVALFYVLHPDIACSRCRRPWDQPQRAQCSACARKHVLFPELLARERSCLSCAGPPFGEENMGGAVAVEK